MGKTKSSGVILRPTAHQEVLRRMLHETREELRIVSPYITESELIRDGRLRKARCITRLSPLDIAAGASNPSALRRLMGMGFELRYVSDRLHAKVYIFGKEHAVVTSANFTRKGLGHNIEAGIEASPPAAVDLGKWFDELWRHASPLTEVKLARCEKLANAARRKLKALGDVVGEHEFDSELLRARSMKVRKDARLFLCNTNRRGDSSARCERAMKDTGYAACWTKFSREDDMKAVRPGDVILMYSKKVGVVAAGVATGHLQVLSDDNGEDFIAPRGWLDRLREICGGLPDEWRVPVAWIDWNSSRPMKVAGKEWRSPQGTFLAVDEKRKAFKGVKAAAVKHFGMVVSRE